MILKKFLIPIFCFTHYFAFSQTAIEHETNIVSEPAENTKEILIPKVTLSNQKLMDPFNPISKPLPKSLLVYNTGKNPNVSQGYYYWNNNQWRKLKTQKDITAITSCDKNTTSKTNTKESHNTANGVQTLVDNNTESQNTTIGSDALYHKTIESENTVIGY